LFDYRNNYKMLIVFVPTQIRFDGSVVLSNRFFYFWYQKLQIASIEITMNEIYNFNIKYM